jgi:hypothetical protein
MKIKHYKIFVMVEDKCQPGVKLGNQAVGKQLE